MNNDLIVQKVLKTMLFIKDKIERSKRKIRESLYSNELEEAAREFRALMTQENILSCLEEDFEQTETEEEV